MSLFLNSLWIWYVITFVVGFCGGAWYFNDQTGRNFIIAIVSPLLTLALGLTLYYGIDTDRKSIIRTLDALVAAVERDDPDTVCQFISAKAEDIQIFARTSMLAVSVSRAKYHGLEIKINDATSPPTANVQFTAVFYVKTKSPIEGFSLEQPHLDTARFGVELVKTKSGNSESWILTKMQHRFRSAR